MEFLLNDKSLHGQFNNVEQFLESLPPVLKTIELIKQYTDYPVSRCEDFYKRFITPQNQIVDLKQQSWSDQLAKLLDDFDKIVYCKPYWDEQPEHDLYEKYYWNGEDVSVTCLAEAAVTGNPLISFQSEKFIDCKIKIEHKNNSIFVDSIHTPRYLVSRYSDYMNIRGDELLRIRYNGTRLDCRSIELKYGIANLEKDEIDQIISSFDKFVRHESWETIALDDGLKYKKYSPSSLTDDWFNNARYRGKVIMKFRCSSVLRCYGYRKAEKFIVLRLERDHKISNNG